MKKSNKMETANIIDERFLSKSALQSIDEVSEFAESIINTVREPLLMLDQDLRVVKASRSFYEFFKVTDNETIGNLIYDLGNHQWDIPKLKELLETILPEKTTFDNYEVEHDFSTIGKRIMLLNARQIQRGTGKEKIILLAIEDITERRKTEESISEDSRMTGEYLDVLLNHAHIPIIIWDSLFVITRINREFEILCGYSWDEIKYKKIDVLFPEYNINSTLELISTNKSGDRMDVVEVDLLTKTKEIKTVLWNSAGIFDKEGKNVVATIAQDITKRKRIEESLSMLETRYRRLFESAKDGILLLNAESGLIIDVNPFMIELLGYSKESFFEKEIWEIGFLKDIAANKEKFLELQMNEYVQYDNLPLETADGRKINVEFVSNVYLVNNHKVIQCNIRDITIRKKSEQALRESEEKFSKAFKTSPYGITITNVDDEKLIEVNETFTEIIGFTREELLTDLSVGLNLWGNPDDRNRVVSTILKGGEVKDLELQFRLKNGGLIDCLLSGQKLLLNDKTCILSSITNITERKHSEEEIVMLAHSLRSINECVSITDVNDKILFVNESFINTYGYDKNELLGKDISIVRSPNNLPESVDKIYTATMRGEWRGELLNMRKGGSEFPVYLSTTIVHDKDKKILGLIGVATDITEQKQILEELVIAKERAEQSDKLKSEFLAQMSHEIRTPLNVIVGSADYLHEIFNDKMNSDTRSCFYSIDRAVKRVIRTVDMVLNTAELQVMSYKPIFKMLDINSEILDKLNQEYKLYAIQKGLELKYVCRENNCRILADEFSVTQIFANLIDNAIKYTKQGKIVVLLEKNITGRLSVEIKDTGIGIGKEFLSRIFEPFTQEEQGYTRSYDGNGLGLALVKKYCELNNMVIEIESDKNVGSTFRVIFNNITDMAS